MEGEDLNRGELSRVDEGRVEELIDKERWDVKWVDRKGEKKRIE